MGERFLLDLQHARLIQPRLQSISSDHPDNPDFHDYLDYPDFLNSPARKKLTTSTARTKNPAKNIPFTLVARIPHSVR